MSSPGGRSKGGCGGLRNPGSARVDRNADGDATDALLERRWFASIAAVRAMQAECELLRAVMELAEDAWRRARSQMLQLEALRDALGEDLADREAQQHQTADIQGARAVSSAA